MVKVGKQDTFKKYYQLNNMKNEINKQNDIKDIYILLRHVSLKRR